MLTEEIELTNVLLEAAFSNVEVESCDDESLEFVEKTIAYSLPEEDDEPLSPLLAAVTVTTQLAEAVPHFAVIVAVPAETAVTLPLLTVATELLDVDHVTVPLAVAVSVEELPATNDNVDLFKETESVVVDPPDEDEP